MAEQRLEKFFNMNAGGYNGVLLRENLAKKMMKLLYKQSQEIKELLVQNLDEVETTNWTLVYPEGKQTAIYYIVEGDDKMQRIKLFNREAKLEYCKDGVFSTDKKGSEALRDVIAFYEEKYGEDVPEEEAQWRNTL